MSEHLKNTGAVLRRLGGPPNYWKLSEADKESLRQGARVAAFFDAGWLRLFLKDPLNRKVDRRSDRAWSNCAWYDDQARTWAK